MNKLILFLAFNLIFLLSLAIVGALTLEVDVMDSFTEGERINFNYSIFSPSPQQITYTTNIVCPNAPQTLLERKVANLNTNEIYFGQHNDLVLDNSLEPQSCTAVLSIVEPIQVVKQKEFEIDLLPSFPFDTVLCKDKNCIEKTLVFVKDENIFLDFVSQVPNPETSAILTYPDKTTEQISMPAKINSDQVGTYSLEVTATKENYKIITNNINFGVIEEEAEIVIKSVCNPNNVCDVDDGENAQTCPQDCPSGSTDDYCDGIKDNICDPDCSTEQDADCRGKETLEEDETRKPSSLAIIIALTFLLIIIIFAYLEFNRLKYHKNLKVNYKEERLNDMREYIQTNLRRGYKKEGIRNALIKIGYNNEEIEEAFRRLR